MLKIIWPQWILNLYKLGVYDYDQDVEFLITELSSSYIENKSAVLMHCVKKVPP